MGAARRVSTEDIPDRDRLGFWNAGAAAIGGVEADRIEDHAFQGVVVRRALGDAKVFRLDTSPHRAAWTRRLIAAGEGDPHVRIWFQHRGSTIVSTRHGEHIVRAGQWSVSDGRYPYVATHLEASRKLALQLPLGRLARHEQDAIARLPGALQVGGGIARMLQACLHSAITTTAETDDRLDADLGETMVDFMRMLLHEQRLGSDVAPMRELTQDRIRAFVRRNVGNPALSVDMIAQAMKCSKRYVHKVFNGDETISEYIWGTRLESCRAALASPKAAQTTLTQIAFENGFSSSAHFSRAFREKFGTAPKAYRAQMLDAGSRTDKTRMSAPTSAGT
ncbi:AraC-like DNA-binding protein [Sphingobium sp. B11D3B]|uniref:helix-turn-helix domain-containing protein n=1 Tax=Sphingobium sp. B11D3B TaxID=2940575 RepID=UPI00222674D4|nr:helix-turn-helix domain-containing protein [Sphingobium sp. B11D3B]MCW2387021.1 AraC-like DNA-binding protein [Sphingobium sp. B11D3B]